MARQEIKLGELVRSAWKKVNENFIELYTNKVDAVEGKGLSTNDYTDEEKQKVADAAGVVKHTFTEADWGAATDGYYSHTIAASGKNSGKNPVKVMRQNGENYDEVIIQTHVNGTNVVLESEEAFAGYLIVV